MQLINISDPSGSLCMDGTYPHGAFTPFLSTLEENSFEVDVEFMVNTVTTTQNNPIVIGGQGYRWVGIQISAEGKIGVSYNNGYTIYSDSTVVADTWYEAKLLFDNNHIILYLNGDILIEDCIVDLETGNDYDFEIINLGNGTSLNGCIKNLKIYNNPATPAWRENHVYNICAGEHVTVGSNTYTETGVYNDTMTSPNGCDKIITSEVNVYPDITVNLEDNTLTANAEEAGYQWINCSDENAVIEDATNVSYTPETTGSYAVIVSANNCVDTSDCYDVLITDVNKNLQSGKGLYPNPTTGKISVDLGNICSKVFITVYDKTGRKMIRQNFFNVREINTDVKDQKPGIYMVQIVAGDKRTVFKLVKE